MLSPFYKMISSNCLLLLFVFCLTALAQTAVVPFAVTGFLGSVSISGNAFNSGGQITVSGYSIKIPDNLRVEFPAAQISFAKFAAGERAGPNEVSVAGNVVNGQIIAAQLTVSQLSLQFGSGYISRLEFDGAIKIFSGPTIRINDPRARYSAGTSQAPFFTSDDENPSITSFAGFPMCVPRGSDDPKCPQSNRPNGQTNYVVPDPMHMAPLKVGDYVEFSGIEVGGEILLYELTANIGIFTNSAEAPGFIKVEDCIIGVINNDANVEFARSRWVGYVTDPSTFVDIYAIDVDPCTGKETDRFIIRANPETTPGGRAKFDVRTDRTDIGLYTRNYRFKLASGTKETSDGILAGQYVQPVTEWILPEVINPGATPPPFDFTNFGDLVNGCGPDVDGNVFHQLNPWPGASAPTPSKTCPDKIDPPVDNTPTSTPTNAAIMIAADAGADQTVRGGLRVSLAARQTTADVVATDLTFTWSQISGPTAGITLSSTTTPNTTFEAPVPAAGATVQREFMVLISHKSGVKGNDTIVVTTDTTSTDHPIIEAFTWQSKQSGTVDVKVTTDLVATTASMKLRFGTGAEIAMVRAGPGIWSYNARSTNRPASVTVRSYFGTVAVGVGVTRTGVTVI